jgi:hypothetical protein
MPLYNPLTLGRWLYPIEATTAANTSQAFTVGRVIVAQFVVPRSCLIDGLAYTVGTTAAGNVIGGILGPVALTADTALAAPVVAQSASTAQATQSTNQVLTWAAIRVAAGIYYAALEGDNATGTYMRPSSAVSPSGTVQFYDRAGGYGTLTDPTPAVTNLIGTVPGFRIRIAG